MDCRPFDSLSTDVLTHLIDNYCILNNSRLAAVNKRFRQIVSKHPVYFLANYILANKNEMHLPDISGVRWTNYKHIKHFKRDLENIEPGLQGIHHFLSLPHASISPDDLKRVMKMMKSLTWIAPSLAKTARNEKIRKIAISNKSFFDQINYKWSNHTDDINWEALWYQGSRPAFEPTHPLWDLCAANQLKSLDDLGQKNTKHEQKIEENRKTFAMPKTREDFFEMLKKYSQDLDYIVLQKALIPFNDDESAMIALLKAFPQVETSHFSQRLMQTSSFLLQLAKYQTIVIPEKLQDDHDFLIKVLKVRPELDSQVRIRQSNITGTALRRNPWVVFKNLPKWEQKMYLSLFLSLIPPHSMTDAQIRIIQEGERL